MNFSETLDAITSRFKTEIQDGQSIAVVYDNDPTDPPNNENYIELSVVFGDSMQRTFGADRRWRTVGVMTARICVEAGLGLKAGVTLADAITDAFRGRTEGQVTYKTPSVTNAGREGRFWLVISTTEFYVDDLE